MFSKGNKVYADTYKFLKHKTQNVFGLVLKETESNVEEIDMSFPIQVAIRGNLVTWEEGLLAFTPNKMDYSSIKEQIIKSRYSNDEQLAIMLNKDSSPEGSFYYNRMQEWRGFATEIAKIVDEEGYIASTALDIEKEKKLAEIAAYDSSKKVNSFTINGIEVWLDKDTRAGLKLRFEAELALGKTDTTLWHGGVQFNLKLSEAIQMLYAIEVYASACYDNTQKHYSIVRGLTDKESVITYDYTAGYPEKLSF